MYNEYKKYIYLYINKLNIKNHCLFLKIIIHLQ